MLESEPDMAVIGEANTASRALAHIQGLSDDAALNVEIDAGVDVVLIDIDVELAGEDGIEVARQLHLWRPTVIIVVLSFYDTTTTRERATSAGASALISKRDAVDQLPQLVRAIYSRNRPG